MEQILIVDDHDVFRMVVCDLLATVRPHARILQAQNGRECIELALAEKPSLILMDVKMPVMDGYEAAKTLRSLPETETIPVIAMAPEADGSMATLGLRDICDAFLLKPFYLDELARAITQVDRPADVLSSYM